MTSKGHSPVDLQSAEPATSRRRLLGALGAAGVASAAALSVTRTASAAPSSPTEEDKVLLGLAMQLELTARDLYEEAAEAGLSDDAAALAAIFAENHAGYADKIAGIAGLSADRRNERLYEELEPAFAGSDDAAFVEAAMSLENTASATQADLVGQYESVDARSLTASICVVEARMATVLADFGDLASNLDDLFAPEAEVLVLTGGEES